MTSRDSRDREHSGRPRSSRNYGRLADLERLDICRTEDDTTSSYFYRKRQENYSARYKLREQNVPQTARETSYSKKIDFSPLRETAMALEAKKDASKNRYALTTSVGVRQTSDQPKEDTATFTKDRLKQFSPTPKKPDIKMLDLLVAAKPPLVHESSEKSFIVLNSYYQSENDQHSISNQKDNPKVFEVSPDFRKNKKKSVEQVKDQKVSVYLQNQAAEANEIGSQLEFVEIPCAKFYEESENRSKASSEESDPKVQSGDAEKIRKLTELLSANEKTIKTLQSKNEQLIQENAKIKQQMTKQIELLTSEVNQAKSMVLSTSTLVPSLQDTARSRNGKSPLPSPTYGAALSDLEGDCLAIVKDIGEAFAQLTNSNAVTDALKSFIEMSTRRIKAGSDLHTTLTTTKDLVITTIEGLTRNNFKSYLRITDLESKADKEKIRLGWLEEEIGNLKWQNMVLRMSFENFQLIISTLARNFKVASRNLTNCSREYFEEIQSMLKKNLNRRDAMDDNHNFSYLNSLVREMTDCIG